MDYKNIGFKDLFKVSFSVVNIGAYLVASTLIGIIIGILLDKLFDTKPIFFFIFLILGFAEGFRNMFIIKDRYLKDLNDKKNK